MAMSELERTYLLQTIKDRRGDTESESRGQLADALMEVVRVLGTSNGKAGDTVSTDTLVQGVAVGLGLLPRSAEVKR